MFLLISLQGQPTLPETREPQISFPLTGWFGAGWFGVPEGFPIIPLTQADVKKRLDSWLQDPLSRLEAGSTARAGPCADNPGPSFRVSIALK